MIFIITSHCYCLWHRFFQPKIKKLSKISIQLLLSKGEHYESICHRGFRFKILHCIAKINKLPFRDVIPCHDIESNAREYNGSISTENLVMIAESDSSLLSGNY